MVKLKTEHKFLTKKCRHISLDKQAVFHCHHYITLTTMLAEDADEMLGSIQILISTMELSTLIIIRT